MDSTRFRLYIGIHPSGVVNNEKLKYHWTLMIGPRDEEKEMVAGTRFHVTNSIYGWKFEEISLRDIKTTSTLLARILIAKITDEERLVALLRRVPVVQNNAEWRCRTWVASALAAIAEDGKCVGPAELDWEKIEACGRRYVGNKTASGRYESTKDWVRPRPTWDILESEEILP
ncbi:hypothetical protein ONZ43_g3601 [Nemania bipapillata]|uniref:Uncharacterized protein n=1 Tax=Nemania bipapillata TaxID=110536 RepID=A0ACC2IWA5_9PEZI|nr:hypothetical protein ONZ43_g3601 [Nemania bipapillata]